MSTSSSDPDWVALLQVAKRIRHSVEPVAPSPGFRRHLRSDLATALDPQPPPPKVSIVRQRSSAPVGVVLGVIVGSTVAVLTLVALNRPRPRVTARCIRPMTDGLAPLIVIVGPTAVGKTRIAIDLAQHVRGEIVCADSRTQYRGMDVGTAKPSPDERALIPHHLLDVIAPNETFTLAQFQNAAYAALADITARRLIPLVVGGSGLYVKCIVEGFRIPEMEPDDGLRKALHEQAQLVGPASLHDELARVDPVAAQRIGTSNTRRLIRALEVYRTLGVPISQLQRKVPPPYRILTIGLTRSLESLHMRIEQRVDAMLAGGLIEEVQRLVAAGYGYELPAMSGIGYREVGAYLRGEITLSAARALIAQNTRRFVRRQYQWFRLTDPTMSWVDLDAPTAAPEVRRLVVQFIENRHPLHEAVG